MRLPKNRFWIFDFDGTISDLVPDRTAAVLHPACRSLLSELAANPDHVVAVISSRPLDDLAGRIEIDGVTLAGASGLEWALPGGHRLGPSARAVDRLKRERRRLLPALRPLARVPGVDLEDKEWSTAVHFRQADLAARGEVARELGRLQVLHAVTIHFGPEVAEVQFLAEVNKEIAVKTLVRLNASRYEDGNILYAGDDQNDALAMKWVLAHHGTAFAVGNRISVPGSQAVDNPADLAYAIRRERLGGTSNESEREGRYE